MEQVAYQTFFILLTLSIYSASPEKYDKHQTYGAATSKIFFNSVDAKKNKLQTVELM